MSASHLILAKLEFDVEERVELDEDNHGVSAEVVGEVIAPPRAEIATRPIGGAKQGRTPVVEPVSQIAISARVAHPQGSGPTGGSGASSSS